MVVTELETQYYFVFLGKTKADQTQGYITKEEDTKYAYVTLVKIFSSLF